MSYPVNILLALVPLSMISILVRTPIVLNPLGSSSLAIYNPSDVEISALADITQSMIVLGSETYLVAMDLVIYSILFGWSEPASGILVIPGKSTRVRSGQVCENIFNTIGLSTIPFFAPATLSVNTLI